MGCQSARQPAVVHSWACGLAVVDIRVSGMFSDDLDVSTLSTLIQESRSLSALGDLSPEEIEEHIQEMTEIRESWAQLIARQQGHLDAVERTIEEVRARLFHAERKELAGLKKS